MNGETIYDLCVVGGGHAACEAALAASGMGARTLMLNLYLDNIALMPCNPSIGGPAKGHLVRELDALGGHQARAADSSTLHLRTLNTSKGAAVRTLRAQCDLHEYKNYYLRELMSHEKRPQLDVYQTHVTSLLVENGAVRGVVTQYGEIFRARAVVLCTGTYLSAKVYVGRHCFDSGPLGQMPAPLLGEDLRKKGLEMGRLRTDTTPRIHRDSVDWDTLPLQRSDPDAKAFSHWSPPRRYDGFFCAQTRTTERTHAVIRAGFKDSALFMGELESSGPRYCPSIDDKLMRFPEKLSHPVFLEPTGRRSVEIYMQNLSTSLPTGTQLEMVRSLPGCGRAVLLRPGYAIEYDYVNPTELYPWLETKKIARLFLAGQINGTSGYEEAAAQGFLVGVNAVLAVRGEDPLVLKRYEAYMGVLVDDLVTKGTREPYRMLTSRCEHRLILRHDNADRRLAPVGRRLGLIDDAQWDGLQKDWKAMDDEIARLNSVKVSPSDAANARLREWGSSPLEGPVLALELLKRPEIDWERAMLLFGSDLAAHLGERVAIEVKYFGYVKRQEKNVSRLAKREQTAIARDFDFAGVPGLSSEGRQKLVAVAPQTLGQAMRISGVTPADIQILLVALAASAQKGEPHDD